MAVPPELPALQAFPQLAASLGARSALPAAAQLAPEEQQLVLQSEVQQQASPPPAARLAAAVPLALQLLSAA